VEASNKEEAFARAKAFRDQRWRERNSREGLEAESEAIKQRQEDNFSTTQAGFAGAGEGLTNAAAGMADSMLGMAGGITDFLATHGTPEIQAKAKQDSETLLAKREEIRSGAELIGLQIREKVAGRALTDVEKQQAAEETSRGVDLGNIIGDIGLTAAPGAAILKASTLPRMIGMGAMEGAVSGFLVSDTRDATVQDRMAQRYGEATIGAGLGAGLAVVPGLFAGAKNWLIRHIRKATGNVAEQRAALDDIGVDKATVGQLSGDPRILAMESEASGKLADQMLREQASQARQGIAGRLGIQLPDLAEVTTGSRRVLVDGLNKVGEALGRMRGARNKAFKEGLDELEEITGGQPVIGTGTFVDTANEIVTGIVENYRNVKLAGPIKAIFGEINAANKAGGLTPKQANSLLLRLEQIKKGGYGIFDLTDDVAKQSESTYRGHAQSIAGTLKKSLEQAFDVSADRMGGNAGQLLKGLRQRYGTASAEIDAIQQDFMSALGMKGSSAQILKKLGDADAESVRSVMQMLDSVPGGVAFRNQLGKALFNQAVSDGSKGAVQFSQKAGEFNLKAFADSLFRRSEASKLQGIITPDQEVNLVRSLKSLKLLFNDPRTAQAGGVFKTHIPVDLQHIAINVMSRDPGFLARLVAGGVQKGKGAEALFYTREGQDILTGAVKSIVEGRRTGTVIPVLLSILGAAAGDEVIADQISE
jgi:hypothetical protein